MALDHREKLRMARRMAQGRSLQRGDSIFATPMWELRAAMIAKRVAEHEIRSQKK